MASRASAPNTDDRQQQKGWIVITAMSRQDLRAHLTATAIAGPVATPRENSLRKYPGIGARDPEHLFGLRPSATWDFDDVLKLMARRCGVSPDPQYTSGPDHIDPDLVLDGLDAMSQRLAAAAQAKATVVIATGHPAGLLAVHAELSRALTAAGCRLLTPGLLWNGDIGFGQREWAEVRYLDNVATLSSRGSLLHSHSPAPMEAMLQEMSLAGELPDLVIADHGLAGAAAQAGIRTVCFADCNDPGLFVGAEEGVVDVCVPIDDNVLPHLYAPVSAYLLHRSGLMRADHRPSEPSGVTVLQQRAGGAG
jgi:hypothetical protein